MHTTRRIQPYFQNHSVVIKADYHIMKMLCKLDLASQMIGWLVELSGYEIKYELRGPMKSQNLVDFLVELSPEIESSNDDHWILHFDGFSNLKGSGVGIVQEGFGNILVEKSMRFDFKTNNNQTKYGR